MTEEQAAEILQTLLSEMESNGYGEILRQARARLQEEFSGDNRNVSYTRQIRFYVIVIIDILESRSSSNLPAIVNNINDHLETGRLDGIEVIIDVENRYDLAQLPDYQELISGLREIYNEISQQ